MENKNNKQIDPFASTNGESCTLTQNLPHKPNAGCKTLYNKSSKLVQIVWFIIEVLSITSSSPSSKTHAPTKCDPLNESSLSILHDLNKYIYIFIDNNIK